MQTNAQDMSPEELIEYKKIRAKMIHELKEENKFLKVEKEYHELAADIEVAKLRKMTAVTQMANIALPPETNGKPTGEKRDYIHPGPALTPFKPEEEETPEVSKKTDKRTLKTT